MIFRSLEDIIGNSQRLLSLDLTRFILAMSVIVSHAWPLMGKSGGGDFLGLITDGKWSLGSIAVSVFFLISGFLISRSAETAKNFAMFLAARVVRLLPGLFLLYLVTSVALVYCAKHDPIVRGDIWDIIKMGVPQLFALEPHYKVSSQHLQYLNSVNGSLWTLKYEICFYLLSLVFSRVPDRLKLGISVFSCLLLALLYTFSKQNWYGAISHFIFLGLFYSIGTFFYYSRHITLLVAAPVTCCGVLAIIALFLGLPKILDVFLLSYFVTCSVFSFSECVPRWFKRYDLSYGIYIYGFLVQQLVIHFSMNRLGMLFHVLVSVIITLFFSFVSFVVIERPALNYFRKKKTWILRAIGQPDILPTGI